VATISDEFMQKMLSQTKSYCIVTFKKGPKRGEPGAERIVWERGRRNFALRSEGKLSIICPVVDGEDVRGLGIFNASPEETKKIMEEDPAVKAGVLTYEIHLCRSFPGDCLPK
jgi:hypothetical protein